MCDELDTCCIGLDSNKVTERRKCAETLKEIINNSNINKILNSNDNRRNWDYVYLSVHRFIRKEGEKRYQDETKQKSSTTTQRVKSVSDPLLLSVVAKANSGEPRLSAIKMIETCMQCFDCHYQRKYFGDVYLTILVKHILPIQKYWQQIDNNHWLDIFIKLKDLYRNPLSLDKENILRGLYSTIKYGALHSSLNLKLRHEFDFVKIVCLQLKSNSFSSQQEIILQLLNSFSFQVSKECRLASCKLGEDISKYLIELYEPRYEHFGGKKSLIFDYLLLQMRLHHPNGVTEGCDAAYAYNWTKWKSLLRSLYSILCSEIDAILRNHHIRLLDNSFPKLWSNFAELFVEVARQVLYTGVLDVTQASVLANFSECVHVAKKPRLEIGIPAIISAIQSKDNWPWLYIFGKLIKNYPETLTPIDYMTILEVLASLQAECKDTVTRHYLYKLLSVMVKTQEDLVEEHLDLERLDQLWMRVWETTLRSVGLNQNEDTTHKQLQMMLEFKKTSQCLTLIPIYTSGVLNLSKHSIETLFVLCKCATIPDFHPNNSDIMIRKYLINFILGLNTEKLLNSGVYSEKITAQVLIGLVIKTWPYQIIKSKKKNSREFKSIEDSYTLSSFEGGLLMDEIFPLDRKNQQFEQEKNSYLVHTDSFAELSNSIITFYNRLSSIQCTTNSEMINLLNGIILILNLLSEMIEFKILTDDTIQDFVNINGLFKNLYEALKQQQNHEDFQVLNLFEFLLKLEIRPEVTAVIRREISSAFLNIFFNLLNFDVVDGADDMDDDVISVTSEVELFGGSKCSLLNENSLNNFEKLQLTAMRILSHYTCVPSAEFMNQTQKHVLDALIQPDFDAMNNVDFQMTVYFLKALNTCNSKTLSEKYIDFILNSLQKLMQARYEDYYAALILLQILKDSLQHVNNCGSDEAKKNALILLDPFYEKRNSYGPLVSVAIAECMGEIIKVDDTLSRWPEIKDVMSKLLDFLKCNYHEVRLSAIKYILYIFTVHSNTSTEALKIQNDMLNELNRKVHESFAVNSNLSAEQAIDEAANRIASALHMYAALISASPIWRKKVLFALVQLVAEKKINNDLIQKVLTIVGKYLNVKDLNDFLNSNIQYLIMQWSKNGRKITDFPFQLFDCQTEIIFFTRYVQTIVPVLLQQNNTDIIQTVCNETNKSLSDIIKDCYPTIMAQFLPIYVYGRSSDIHNISLDDLMICKRLFKQLKELLHYEYNTSLLVTYLDQVIVQLLARFFDYEHFTKQFDMNKVLPESDPPFYNYELFILTLKYIEDKLSDNSSSIVAYCIAKCASKLERILFETTKDLYEKSTVEEKLIALHRYSILVDYIMPELKSENPMKIFLVRSITCNLMNVIKLYNENELLSIAACRYFKAFCAKCLPFCSDIFEKFLILIVSTLVPIAKLNNDLSKESISVLNFLLIENSNYLYNSIGSLDPFPNDKQFEKIQNVYETIKYGNDTFTLEQEIKHFLNVGHAVDVCDRTEGLQHLRQQLSNKKSELTELYKKLHSVRGFCQDCENSILHQLIVMLVQLTKSTISQVKLEAARCLGELGPSNLTTLVLKPEKTILQIGVSPLELVTGQVAVQLAQYLVSHEVAVTRAARDALYAVLSTREGANIVKNGENLNFGCGELEKSYIVPFLPTKMIKLSTQYQINETEFRIAIDHSDLWSPTTQYSHSEWINTLVSELLKTFPVNCFLRELIPVCQAKVQFSEQLLPLVIFLILSLNNAICTNVISTQMERFFSNHWQGTMSSRTSLSQASTDSIVVFNRASVQCMLNVVHYIRLQQRFFDNKVIDELQLNYLHVAQGAQFCAAYFTSILYAELWCYNQLEQKQYDSQNTRSTLELACENQPSELTLAFENMLREGYKKIGDTDAMNGCGTSYILNTKSRIEYYKNLGRWDKVILHHDTQLANESQTPQTDLVNALKNNSLHFLASNVKTEELNTQYECAWRLNKWNLSETTATISTDNRNEYEKFHYLALKSQHERDLCSMNHAINQARTCIINSLSHVSLESSKSLYKPLTDLQMLQEIENFSEAKSNGILNELFEKWKPDSFLNQNEFEYVEPIRAQRISMFNDIFLNDNKELVKVFLVDMQLQLADEARLEGFYHVSQRALNNLSGLDQLTPEMRGRMLFEQAQLSWLDDKTSGRYLLKYLLENNDTVSLKLLGMALKLYGNWMVETRSENPTVIIENYFEKSLEILNDFNETEKDIENRCEALDSLARFADAQYQQVSSYIDSSSFESKIQTIKKFRVMAGKISKQPGDNTSDEKKAIALYDRQSKIDEAEVSNAYKEKDMYLILAVQNYLRILEYCDSYNLKIFRILSLSLDNKANKDLLYILKQVLPTIPSYKYIPLLPQLVPHIGGNQNDLFEKIIQELLERCALDHPHHTLPIILALADSYKDRNYDPNANTESVEIRVQTAKDLLVRLKKKKPLTQIIHNMEMVSTALVSLAYVDASKCTKSKQQYSLPKGQTIKSIRNLDNVLVPTINMDVRKSRNYNGIIGIHEFSNSFSLVGGVNAPKKITCTGTDGIERTQLVKGKDDLRQDAVMQQVFNIMNTLLAKNKQTSKLLIRTYKVVPLSQRSGVIEWCENTEPLGTYLTDAHKKYHPTDWSPNDCRVQLRSVHMKDHNIKLKKYKEICAKLRPVFHMFFISSYTQSTVWYDRRRAYMHSVATSSMVGYILGLGDRHVHNILLDTSTAEVIHIDFGIAFEQGKVLPSPETVPFRLTRDIEAGMGICGIEGVFRRSCEKTMHVLRQNAETVLTILQVLLYDPLYVWTITPGEAYSRQRDDDDRQSINFSEDDTTPVNVTAERALLRLKQKLQGMENGSICSVEGQVELLLQQARDPVNLSRLFNGWQPYL